MDKPLIIFHAPCPDGTCGAWVAWKHFKGNVDLFPTNYGNKVMPEVDRRDVYLIDFSYPKDVLLEMAKKAKRIMILDHHKTAQADLEGIEKEAENVFVNFNMNMSGAALAWEFFKTDEHGSTEQVPLLVSYVEDRDLWNWKLPLSREINAAISSYDLTVEVYDKLSLKSSEELYDEGFAILRYQYKEIDEAIKYASFGQIGNYLVPIINCSVKSIASEIGNRLAKDYPFAIIWSMMDNGKIYHSFRSIMGEKNPIGIDVSEVAKSFGGGGHPQAAGATCDDPIFKICSTLAAEKDKNKLENTKKKLNELARETGFAF